MADQRLGFKRSHYSLDTINLGGKKAASFNRYRQKHRKQGCRRKPGGRLCRSHYSAIFPSSFVIHLLKLTGNVNITNNLAGHSQFSTTMMYTNLLD